MDEYKRTHGQIPSSLSNAAEQVAGTAVQRPVQQSLPTQERADWWNRPWWEFGKPGFQVSGGHYPYTGYQNHTYVNDDETILDGLLTVSLNKKDVIVVPEGKIEDVPEKYRCNTIELPFCTTYSGIRGR